MKKVKDIQAQIKRCHALIAELGKNWNEMEPKMKGAIDTVCVKYFGYHAHSIELSRYLKKHPELY